MHLKKSPSLDTRIPDWNLSTLVDRSCPLCGDKHPERLIRPDGLPLAYCKDCSLWYVNRVPPNTDLINIYEDYCEYFRKRNISSLAALRIKSNAKYKARKNILIMRLTH